MSQDHDSSWRKDVLGEMTLRGETWEDVESSTLTDAELDEVFCHAFGGTSGKPFTLWTKRRVYFPVKYDGTEWVSSVSRNPDGLPTEHVGGG